MPRRRPTLLQTAARTAVITKTATTVAGNSAQKQAAAAAPAAAPTAAPVPAAAASDDVVAKIERLAALLASGALTDEEFAALKLQAIG